MRCSWGNQGGFALSRCMVSLQPFLGENALFLVGGLKHSWTRSWTRTLVNSLSIQKEDTCHSRAPLSASVRVHVQHLARNRMWKVLIGTLTHIQKKETYPGSHTYSQEIYDGLRAPSRWGGRRRCTHFLKPVVFWPGPARCRPTPATGWCPPARVCVGRGSPGRARGHDGRSRGLRHRGPRGHGSTLHGAVPYRIRPFRWWRCVPANVRETADNARGEERAHPRLQITVGSSAQFPRHPTFPTENHGMGCCQATVVEHGTEPLARGQPGSFLHCAVVEEKHALRICSKNLTRVRQPMLHSVAVP